MLDLTILAFATFFATIGPIDVAAMFAALTTNATSAQRRSMALRGTLLGAAILLVFALIGEALLSRLGISLAAMRTAGGILLLLIGIDMVFARSSGGVSTTDDETREAFGKEDITVFPLATPLIAGPGAMGAAILLMANTEGDLTSKVIVLLALGCVLVITLVALLGASQIQRIFGVTGLHVISRVFGVLLCALAVQFVFDGIGESGLLRDTGAERVETSASAGTPEPNSPAPDGTAMVSGRAPEATGGYPSVVALVPRPPSEFPPPAEPAEMDQAGMAFYPPVLLVQPGQAVHFINSEDIMHNVRVFHSATREPEFNVATPLGGAYEHIFHREGAYAVSCDIHPAMTATILALSTPYAVIAERDGTFSLPNVPTGSYTLRIRNGGAWMERDVEIRCPDTELVVEQMP